jgi:hypothetical protein
MRTGVDGAGTPWITIMSPAEHQSDVAPFFAATPFFEGADGAWKIVSMLWDNERPPNALVEPF